MSILKYIINVDEADFKFKPSFDYEKQKPKEYAMEGFCLDKEYTYFRPSYHIEIDKITFYTTNPYRTKNNIAVYIDDKMIGNIYIHDYEYTWNLLQPYKVNMGNLITFYNTAFDKVYVNIGFAYHADFCKLHVHYIDAETKEDIIPEEKYYVQVARTLRLPCKEIEGYTRVNSAQRIYEFKIPLFWGDNQDKKVYIEYNKEEE